MSRKWVYKYIILILISALFPAQKANTSEIDLQNPTNYVPKIFPSAAESFKFGNYGNTPVGLFTGAPNINIPLIEYQHGSINIPISVNYSSNGINIDETNGSVGLGWSFIAAGVINETVRGLPDGTRSSLQPHPNIDEVGLWNPDVVNFLNDVQDGAADGEADLYVANFCGRNLKFVFDDNDRPLIFSQEDYLIRRGTDSFTIIGNDGTEYFFGEKEKVINRNVVTGGFADRKESYSWHLSRIREKNGNEVYIEYFNRSYNSIVSESQSLVYTPPGLLQYEYNTADAQCTASLFIRPAYNGLTEILTTNQQVHGKQIKRIYNNTNTDEIIFLYNEPVPDDTSSLSAIQQSFRGNVIKDLKLNYSVNQNGRLYLDSIINLKDAGKYKFEYLNKEEFPARLSEHLPPHLSKSRDIWGLYNGQPNQVLVPQIFEQGDPNAVIYEGANQTFNELKGFYGLLNRIEYPTGGSSEIFYEPHKKNEVEIVPGPRENVILTASSNSTNPRTTQQITITPRKTERLKFLAFVSYNLGGSCTDPGQHISKAALSISTNDGQLLNILVYSPTINSLIPAPGFENGYLTLFEDSTFNEFYVDLQKDQAITFTLTAYRCVASTVTFDYANGYDTEINILKPFGGFRVAKTIDNPVSGSQIVKNYEYMDGNESTVHIVRKPYFLENQTTRSYCEISYAWNDLLFISLTSNNINRLVSSHPNIFYSMVTEKIIGKGKTVHYYNVNADYFGKTLKGNDISTAPWTNFGWDNGKEIKTIYYDEQGKIVKKVEYEYVEDENRKKYIDGISYRKNYVLKLTNDVTIPCTAENVNEVHYRRYCITAHRHIFELSSGDCIADGYHNKDFPFYGYCYHKPIGSVVITPNVFENIDFVQYKSYSYFPYLKSEKTTDYLNNSPLVTEIRYFYNNQNYHGLSVRKSIFPDGSIEETAYTYPFNTGNQYLTSKNIVSTPILTEVKKDAITISKIETAFPSSQEEAANFTMGLPLPYKVRQFNTQTNNMSDELIYDLYDSKGNLLQYTMKDSQSTAIIWGYNQTLPIAKIVGAAYPSPAKKGNEIPQSLIYEIVAASDLEAAQPPGSDEATFLAVLDNFRSNPLLNDFQVTTYTYDPSIGVRSITPPSGIREYYIYDTANRLERVEDVNHNILKKYEYHYKTP
ncbi:hypothetical protein [Chryseobacterium koreense]|uniref:hypothetical protein n=1 Tax=Chryseobacterium koreense TaxID=232216 RepID=UPI0026E9B8EB|nr:hypothetical protein [Chryseobacterium koreense]